MATFGDPSYSHESYALFRPIYPRALYDFVLSYHRGQKKTVIDLGAGHGLVSRGFSPFVDKVTGIDPSPGMIAQARSTSSEYSNITFHEGSAEALPFVADGEADLVVAGQAAHWFNYAKLWPEMKRVVRPGGTLAFWGYKDAIIQGHPRATEILENFSYGRGKFMLGDYWDEHERDILRNQYREIVPPDEDWQDIERIHYEPEQVGIKQVLEPRLMKLGEYMQYVRTWSSFHKWQHANSASTASDEEGSVDIVNNCFDSMVRAEDEWRDTKDWKEIKVVLDWGGNILLARRRVK